MIMIEVGKTYVVNHRRKGRFIGKVVADNDGSCDIEIIEGKARYVVNPDAYEGEVITVRTSFCKFEEVSEGEQ